MVRDLPIGCSGGEVIEDRFALEERVGRGAWGEVYRALDRETGGQVAVKRLLSHLDEPIAADRFSREARLLARVESPHVVGYIADGLDRRGRPCLVVEWLEGEDLARRQRRARLTPAEAIEVGRQAALGLEALHRVGIVHRDVKPSNLFLVRRDDEALAVKLIDLGVARATAEATLTTAGVALGTPFYMSPEQARGEERVTPRADQFSLGAVLFELLSGRRAFAGDDLFAVLAKIVLQEVPRLRDAAPGVPDEIDAVVTRVMRKDAQERFASARDLAEALAALPPWSGPLSQRSVAPDAPTSTTSAALSATLEQRVITSLFAGLPGGSVEEAARETFASIAAEHGGVAHRMLGGRVVAVFGGARTTGDEVARAARAALAARARIPGLALSVATGRATARAGGAGTRDAGDPAGDQLAGEVIERGAGLLEGRRQGIAVDEPTARLLADHFLVEREGDRRVLRGERPAAEPPRTLVGKPTPCVGRDRELATLDATFAESIGEPVARAVLVTGAAGVGKSRLRHELLQRIARAETPARVLVGRGDALSAGSAFGLLAPAIRRAAGVLDGEPPAAQRAKLAALVGGALSAPGVATAAATAGALAEMLGIPAEDAAPRQDAMLAGDRMRAAFEDWLAAETAAQPVVLLLEDLHWGDLPSVRFVDAALRALADRPLMVVAFARPEVHERFPALWAGRGVQEIRVGPLTPKASERLVREALGGTADEAAIELIVRRAEGNAFYMEELIRAVAAGARDALPDTVLGMLQARLDALGAEPKRILRAASIFGQTFWRGGLMALLGGAERTGALGEVLEQLVAREVISVRSAARFPGETELTFRHALVRDAAYAMLTEEDRAVGHRLAGEWLERAGEADAAALARHFERGKDLGRAAHLYVRASERALRGNDFGGAIAHVDQAIACGAADEERGAARLVQAEAHRWRAELAEASVCGTEAAELLARGSAAWFQAVREVIAANGRLGQVELVAAWVEEALSTEAAADAEGLQIAALCPAAVNVMYAGQLEAARAIVARLDALVVAAGPLDPVVLARLHQLRAIMAHSDGDPETSLREQESALAKFEQAGDLRNACLTLSNLGFVYADLGGYSEAEDALRRAHRAAEKMGLSTIAPLALHNLGPVLAMRGEIGEALAVEERAMEAFRAHGDPRLEAACRLYLSAIHVRAGDLDAAEAQARAVADSPGATAPMRVGALASLGRALLGRGLHADAALHAGEAAELLAPLGSIEEFEILPGLVLAEALHASGDRDGAKSALAGSLRRLLTKADKLRDPALRARLLEAVPENARVMALAEAWNVEPRSR